MLRSSCNLTETVRRWSNGWRCEKTAFFRILREPHTLNRNSGFTRKIDRRFLLPQLRESKGSYTTTNVTYDRCADGSCISSSSCFRCHNSCGFMANRKSLSRWSALRIVGVVPPIEYYTPRIGDCYEINLPFSVWRCKGTAFFGGKCSYFEQSYIPCYFCPR